MQIQGFEVKLDDDALAWRETRHAGIRWLPLHEAPAVEMDGVERASAVERQRGPRDSTVLIRMAPGRGYPAHRHLDVEEVLILRGGYRDADGEHRTGTYLRYAKDSVHSPVALGDVNRPEGPDNPACILFAVARGGVVNVD